MNRSIGIISLLVLLGTTSLYPALAQPSKAMQKANSLAQSGDWEAAIRVLEKAVSKEEQENPAAWFLLSRSYEQTNRWPETVRAANLALEHGFQRPGLAQLAIARSHAEIGNTKLALTAVEESAKGGSNRFLLQALTSSKALAPLTNDPRFSNAVQSLTPCTSEAYRQFDFWLGNHRVETPSEAVVGTNEITLHLGGCLLMESWQGSSGMHGMSMNFYDPNDDTWNQVFVDNNGNPGVWPPLKGKLEADGSMVLWSPEGESQSKWTWKKSPTARSDRWRNKPRTEARPGKRRGTRTTTSNPSRSPLLIGKSMVPGLQER